jgi:hypothetical protein
MQKICKSGIILRLKRKNPQIPKLLPNFPRFLGFWEFPNHEFIFPICYRISLDLGNFPRSGTTATSPAWSVGKELGRALTRQRCAVRTTVRAIDSASQSAADREI